MMEVLVSAAGDPVSQVSDVEHRARRFETPCGEGVVVWRAWGKGPPVLLLHGAHGSWSHWVRNIDALAAEQTVWAVDIPGFGESGLPPGQDHAAIAGVLATGLWQLLGSDASKIDVVGFSFGGVVAAHLSVFYPELVRQLIIVGAGGLDTPKNNLELRSIRGLEGEDRRAAHRHNLLALMLHDPASAGELALYLQELNATRGRLNPVPFVLPDRLLLVLPKITAPLSAIWGQYDFPHPNPAVQEAVLRRFHPHLEFRVIPGAGHWVMFERADEFNRALLDILKLPLRPSL